MAARALPRRMRRAPCASRSCLWRPARASIGLPAIGAGEALLAVYLTPGDGPPASAATFTPVDRVAVPRRARRSRPAPTSPHTAWVFIASRTGMMVKRPAVGGEGFVLDHYDRGALDRYLAAVGTPLLDALSASRPYAVFCDSLEVFGSDWTPQLLDAFQRTLWVRPASTPAEAGGGRRRGEPRRPSRLGPAADRAAGDRSSSVR